MQYKQHNLKNTFTELSSSSNHCRILINIKWRFQSTTTLGMDSRNCTNLKERKVKSSFHLNSIFLHIGLINTLIIITTNRVMEGIYNMWKWIFSFPHRLLLYIWDGKRVLSQSQSIQKFFQRYGNNETWKEVTSS